MAQPLPERQEELTTCATHPEVATNLRCGKCGTLICPRCLVYTPVGARCRECAQLRRLPQFEVGPVRYLRAAGAVLAIAVVAGMVWNVLPFGGFFSFILSGATGYFIGEGVNRATNRRQSTELKVMAGAGVVLAYLVSLGGIALLVAGPVSLIPFLVIAVTRTLLNPFAWLTIAVGVYIAVVRVG